MNETTTKSWGEAQAPETPNRKEVTRLKVDKEETMRLVGDVLPRYVYWVTTSEGKKMPVECLDFNRSTEKFDKPDKNPFDELPEEVFKEKAQFAYICNVVDRSDNSIKIFDLKRTVYTQIIEFAQNPEYGNPADEAKGYNITVKKEKTGPLPQNVKYSCMPGRASAPLSDEEKELELFDLNAMYKRPTYDEQKQWLMQNTTYFVDLGGDENKVESAEDL